MVTWPFSVIVLILRTRAGIDISNIHQSKE